MATDRGTPDPVDAAAEDGDALAAVQAAAVAVIVAQVEDADVDGAMREALDAARAALDAGHPISAIAAAEAAGQQAGRDRAGAQLLRAIERSARKQREALEEYEELVAKGVAIGVATRDIAVKAQVSHGTVGAIARRREAATRAAADAASGGDQAE